MLVKALPGLGIALALAVFFNLPAGPERPAPRSEGGARRTAPRQRSVLFPVSSDNHARVADNALSPVVPSGFADAAKTMGQGGDSPRPAANAIFSGATLPAKTAATDMQLLSLSLSLPLPLPLPLPTPKAPASELPATERDGIVRMRGTRLAGKSAVAITSHSALASVDAASTGVAAGDVASACAEPPPPFRSRSHYRELPAKGIYAWSRVEKSKVKMNGNRTR